MKKTMQRRTPIQWLKYQGKVLKKNWGLLMLCMPCLIGLLLFNYIPMPGIIVAFKDYTFKGGIFGSRWCGLDNFRFFFTSSSAWYIIRNTVGYFLANTIVGLIVETILALLLFEINSKRALKFYQTVIQFPRFMSWVVIGFVTYAVFSPSSGILNQILTSIGAKRIDVYTTRWVWPFIMVSVQEWAGMASSVIMYYAKLMGADPALYEAAAIDGATKLQQTWHISIPTLTPLITILMIMHVGGMFTGSFDPYYCIPRDIAYLYPVTDNIATFVTRGLRTGDYGPASAISLAQSVIGLVLVLTTNAIVKKIEPDNAMF